jgi:aryl-alcohol dehydrogenase
MTTIRAAILREPHKPLVLEEVRLSAPRANEILVELTATGVCHSDVAVAEQILPLPPPIVLGHEGAGFVREVGSAVMGYQPGDPVVLTFDSCGQCPSCATGVPGYCDAFAALNFAGVRPDGSALVEDRGAQTVRTFFGQGSFATHAIVHARNTIRVRRDAPLKFLGPLGCGMMTGAGTVLNVLKPDRNASLVIAGAGAVGFAAMFAARIAGCRRILMIDRVKARLDLARELAPIETLDTSGTDLDTALSSFGAVELTIDTTGVPRVIEALIRNLKVRGQLILLGASPEKVMTTDILHLISGRSIRGVVEGDSDPAHFIPYLVDRFLEGQFPLDRISQFYPFGQINTAIGDGVGGKTIKPVVEF